jgi:hypothetical protein
MPRLVLNNVDSSCIDCIGHDNNDEILAIRFNSGNAYAYYNVPESVYLEFMNAKSHGAYFNAYIRKRYNFEKVI